MSGEFKFLRDSGKAYGSGGWSVDHGKSSSITYTGLWRNDKVIAILVSNDQYGEQEGSVKQNGDFIVRACNAHASLINALTLLKEKVEANGGDLLGYRDEIAHARAALAAAGAA